LCGKILKEEIVCDANAANAFSIIADESADISGDEQNIPNIPLFCETRWSSKYKSIRLFSENFIAIIQSLQSLSINGLINSNTRQRALCLYSSTSNFSFIISMKIIAKYSAILEPVTNILQGVPMELYKVREHVEELIKMFENNRTNANEIFDLLFTDAKSIADDF
jgi:hypothetical protein